MWAEMFTAWNEQLERRLILRPDTMTLFVHNTFPLLNSYGHCDQAAEEPSTS